jgi:hypothetical protein
MASSIKEALFPHMLEASAIPPPPMRAEKLFPGHLPATCQRRAITRIGEGRACTPKARRRRPIFLLRTGRGGGSGPPLPHVFMALHRSPPSAHCSPVGVAWPSPNHGLRLRLRAVRPAAGWSSILYATPPGFAVKRRQGIRRSRPGIGKSPECASAHGAHRRTWQPGAIDQSPLCMVPPGSTSELAGYGTCRRGRLELGHMTEMLL